MAEAQQHETSNKLEGLQWMREMMAVLISLVILVLSAGTLWFTFIAAGATAEAPSAAGAPEQSKQQQIDAYNRQKDVMLYALALFGTVTGYYLGRVPAEANAKRAENIADSAQKQLSKTQERLTDAAASASAASAQLGNAREEKSKVAANLKNSTQALREVRSTLASVAADRLPGRATLGGPSDMEGGAGTDPRLKQAQDRIDAVLTQIESQVLS